MADVLGLIESKDLLSFSQNYSINRNYVGNRIFPDMKTENMEAEFYALSALNQLPTLAMVHALDTESAIGNRPGLDKFNFEKLLIKEKINQSERAQILLNKGVSKTGLVRYIYDDMNNLANNVIAKAEKLKMDVLTTGQIALNENGVVMTIDYGVPGTNKKSYDWGSPDHDILADIQTMVDIVADTGAIVSKVVTSRKIIRYMQTNKGIQAAINSALGIGAFIDDTQINALMQRMFGFTFEIDEDKFATVSVSAGVQSRSVSRFFPENKFVLVPDTGIGLWGATPEELAYAPYSEKNAKQFVTMTQWQTPDPVALWSKATGMMIPIMPSIGSLVIATISFDGNEHALDSLDVTSSASATTSGKTAISVSPALTSGNSYKYKVDTDMKLPAYNQNLRTWSTWDGTSEITATTGKELCIAEVDADYRAVKAGIATVTSKA
jgi:hypothetical protein